MVNTEEVIKKAKQAIKICSDIDTARLRLQLQITAAAVCH